jgi:hypothetical protein
LTRTERSAIHDVIRDTGLLFPFPTVLRAGSAPLEGL